MLAVVPARLQEPSFLILTALAGRPQHGYGIIKDVVELSVSALTLRVGTLYGALDRLAAEGLVEIESEEIVDSRLRRNYRLTAAGAERLSEEAARTRRQATAALRRLRVSGVQA